MANSYRDPTYDRIDRQVEQELDLPNGLLSSIRTKGERSNADQVSEAGARTVYQVIPSTRNAVLKKYGVDAYQSPQMAAKAAGLLLRESLDRNKGNRAAAVAEYHGGTDRSQWGPRTRAYVSRVTKGGDRASGGGGSTYDRVQGSRQRASDGPSMASVYEAYKNTGKAGGMIPQEAAQFEQAVLDGHIMLPRGAQLRKKPAAPVLPQSVVEAYNSHRMDDDPAARTEIERAVQAGEVSLPRGVRLQKPEARTTTERLGMGVRNVMEGGGSLVDVVAGPLNAIVNALPGEQGLSASPFRDAATSAADAMGLATPESDTENLISAINEGGTQGLLSAGTGLLAAPVKGATGTIGRAVSSNPVLDTVAGATSGAASESARQAGAGPVGQVVAGLAGGLAPVGPAVAISRIRTPRTTPRTLPDVVAETPRAAVIDEAGNLTPDGQEIAARHNVTPEQVREAYEAPPSVRRGTANDEARPATAREATTDAPIEIQAPDDGPDAAPNVRPAPRPVPDAAEPAQTRTVRRHQGTDYPVEVIDRGVQDAEGKVWARVRGDDGAVGYVPDNEIVDAPVARSPTPEASATPATPETVPTTARQRVLEGKEVGVDYSRGQATKDFDIQDRETQLRNSAGAQGDEMRAFAAKQTEQVNTAAQQFRESVGDTTLTPEDRGKLVQEAVRELRDLGQKGVSALYKHARDLGEEIPLETVPIRNTFEGLMAEADIPEGVKKVMEQEAARYGLIGEPVVIDKATGKVTNDAGVTTVKLDDGSTIKFRGEPQNLRLDNAEEFRKVISKQYPVDGPQKLTQELKRAIDDAVEAAAVKSAEGGDANLSDAMKTARQAHVAQQQTFKSKDIVQSIADWKRGAEDVTGALKPEQVMQRALANVSDLKRVKAVLLSKPTVKSKAAWQAIKAHGLADIFSKATTRTTNAAGEITEAVSGAKLRTAIENFGPDKLKVLLDPDQFNQLMKLRRVIEDVTVPISGTVNNSNSANLLMRLVKDVDNQVTAAFGAAGMAVGGPAGAAIGGTIGRTISPAIKAVKEGAEATETLRGATKYTPEQAATDKGAQPSMASKAATAAKSAGTTAIKTFIDTYASPRVLAPVIASTTGAEEE